MLVEQLLWCATHENLSALDVSKRLTKRYHRPPPLTDIEEALLAMNPSTPPDGGEYGLYRGIIDPTGDFPLVDPVFERLKSNKRQNIANISIFGEKSMRLWLRLLT
jgi:hypothetical protein